MYFVGTMKAICILILIVWCNQNNVFAEFGTNGMVITPVGTSDDSAYSIIVQPDGKLVVAGDSYNNGNYDIALVRYHSNGSLDSDFGVNGKVTTPISRPEIRAISLIVQPDGKLVAAGYSDNGSNYDFALVRYNQDGSLDQNFGMGGQAITDSLNLENAASDLILQPDGKLVAVGLSENENNDLDFALVRYNSNGSLDTGFGSAGKVITPVGVTHDYAYSLSLQPDGKLVVAGSGTNDFHYNFTLVRYNQDGSLDADFGSDGKVTTPLISTKDYAKGLIVQPDGKLVVAGDSHTGSHRDLTLMRYNSDGAIDTSFGTNGKVITAISSSNDATFGLIVQPDGKLVVAGYSYDVGNTEGALVRYNIDGSLDSNFGTGGKVITPIDSSGAHTQSLVVQPDGKLVAAGSSNEGSDLDFAVVRYNNDGTLDTQVDPPLLNQIKPDHGVTGQTIILDIQGWNFDEVTVVQLRHSTGSINASNLEVTHTKILAQLTLSGSAGIYDLLLAKSNSNRTYKSMLTIQSGLVQPIGWQVTDLGRTGNPIPGPKGIAIGDGDHDQAAELYVATNDDRIYIYKKNATWTITSLPFESAGFFQDVLLADFDYSGEVKVYGSNNYPRTIEYHWTGSTWEGNSINAHNGPLAIGSLVGGSLKTLYALSGNSLMQSQLLNQEWSTVAVGQGSSSMVCSVSGDVNNDGINEVYGATSNNKLLQFRYDNIDSSVIWVLPEEVFSGSSPITCLVIGDLDQNGRDELYGSNSDGHIYQFTWTGSAWAIQALNASNLIANEIVIGDGDNDGDEELYAAGQDGHVYQLKYNTVSWQVTDLGQTETPLMALAIGDGDHDNQLEVYSVGANAHVYEFYLAGHVAPTATAIPTPNLIFGGALLDKKYVYPAPHPIRGSYANIYYHLAEAGHVKIKIFTTSNKLVIAKDFGQQPAGKNYWQWQVDNLANGVYLMLITAENDRRKTKLIKKLGIIK